MLDTCCLHCTYTSISQTPATTSSKLQLRVKTTGFDHLSRESEASEVKQVKALGPGTSIHAEL
jgi:hypothetical protein